MITFVVCFYYIRYFYFFNTIKKITIVGFLFHLLPFGILDVRKVSLRLSHEEHMSFNEFSLSNISLFVSFNFTILSH